MTYAHIVGWGKYVPEKVVTNDDLAKIMDTSDDWIKSRTGISQRRFAGKDETTASMAIAAAQLALDRARIAPSAIDLIIVATLCPEHIFPSTACLVQDALGAANAGAFDLSAACAGFVYGLAMGAGVIRSGMAKVVLVIGSETLSRVLDIEDRTTYPLFGDGAGAVVLQADETPGGILSTVLGSDGSGAEHLCIPAGGSKLPASRETVDQRLHYIKMNGREVYRFATRVMGKAAKQACEKAGVPVEEIDLFIPHQANVRIIESASKALKISDDKVFTNLDKYGNTSAASIPIALCEAIEAGRVENKDKLVMVGFGGGLTWGATVIEWGVPMPYKQREWWYKALRWMVYRWARVRSATIRLTRWLESLLPAENQDDYLAPPKEKQKEEISQPQKEKQKEEISQPQKGNGVKPTPVELPTKLPVIKPVEPEERVMEIERPLNGK
ncbi:MAG: ketoacyl-ACP synthase III [Anaerolineales bacterium]|nr:ketoacyl-ACP synthase III [Anaerolineales bacterium]